MMKSWSILLSVLLVYPALLQAGEPIEKEKPSDWSKHDPPTHFHGGFQTPASVWKVDGGHFIAYEAGEFGGALFFLANENTRLKLLLRGHVNSLAWVGNSTYIAAGGLAHGREHGSSYRVWVDDDLEWNSDEVLSTWVGIPTIIMTTDPETAYCSIVNTEFGLQGREKGKTHLASFEVHADGSLEYLGPPKIDEAANKPSHSSPERAESK
jgi:hypothetical protein